LRNFATTKQLNQQQVRWAEQLANYKFQIHYKKGNENGEADALSRQPDHKGVKKIHAGILSMTAPVLTYTILQELVSNHELPKEFIINRDKLFTSKFWETLTAELRINHKMSTAYHPQTDGQSKQMNQMVKTYLRHYVNRNQDN